MPKTGFVQPFEKNAEFWFSATSPGHADISVELDGKKRTYGIDVVERAELRVLDVPAVVQVGAVVEPVVHVNAVSSSDMEIRLSTDDKKVLDVPSRLVIPGGETSHSFTSVASATGNATLTATYEGTSVSRTVRVVKDVNLAKVELEPRQSLRVGDNAELLVELDAIAAKDVRWSSRSMHRRCYRCRSRSPSQAGPTEAVSA